MSLYLPVVVGESGLRGSVEALLDGNTHAVDERLAELDAATQKDGMWATFGTEVEFQFFDGVNKAPETVDEHDAIYHRILGLVRATEPVGINERFNKGDVINPDSGFGPVMENRFGVYNTDTQGSTIIEVRTSPESALVALNRYWRVVDAVGTIAAEEKIFGMIMSTHVNSGVIIDREKSASIMGFHSEQGPNLLAATQHNLEVLYPLQIGAGLETGVEVIEAFPHTKDAATTVHPQRLEMRHPLVGIADPRIDMLAFLDGVQRTINGSVPETAVAGLRRVVEIHDIKSQDSDGPAAAKFLKYFIANNVGIDPDSKKLVMPTSLDSSDGSTGRLVKEIAEIIDYVAGGDGKVSLYDTDRVLEELVGSISVNGESLEISDDYAHAENLRSLVRDFRVRKSPDYEPVYRTLPRLIFDSPEVHLSRRRRIVQNEAVKGIVGPAVGSIVGGLKSVRRRQQLIQNQMVVLG